MLFNLKTIATINIVIQFMLMAADSVAVYIVIKKRKLKMHCLVLRIAVPVLLVTIIIAMLPGMLGVIRFGGYTPLLTVETYVHHSLGLLVIGVWVYINLVFARVIKGTKHIRIIMRLAFASWLTTFLIGLNLYLSAYILA